MQEVADEVGYSKGTVYKYFKSKDELYLASGTKAYELIVDYNKALTTISYNTSSSGSAFSKLANYIFSKNEQKESIAMTAPVLMEPVEEDNVKIYFFLPKKYYNRDFPNPLLEDLQVESQGEKIHAILGFHGFISDAKRRKKEEKLLKILQENSIPFIGKSFLLQYSDPFVPPPLRINEVAFEVNLH